VVEPKIGTNRLATLRLPPDDTSKPSVLCDVFTSCVLGESRVIFCANWISGRGFPI